MENVHTLMLFCTGQQQAVVLQYKTAAEAKQDRDHATNVALSLVRLADSYGRELTLKPADVQMALVQDIDAATRRQRRCRW